MTPFVAELLGTMFLVLLGCGAVAGVVLKESKAHNSGWIVITTGWALGVFVGVVIAGSVSGAHLNPAVSIGLAIAGKFAWTQLPGYILAQLLGAMLGAMLTLALYFDHFKATPEQGSKLAVFATAPAIKNNMRNLLSEIIGTFVLVFVIFHFTGGTLEQTPQIPIGLGAVGAIPVAFLVWVIGLSLGGTTGYAINPARDLMPRLVHAIFPIPSKGDSNWCYAWIPVFGPITGGGLAALLHLVLS